MSTRPNVNTVTLSGQLAADPVLRGMPDGRNVCDLRAGSCRSWSR
ncbi:MAG TPA: hypothetical protein VNZ01_07100 [Solirubrobacteraceae bacterium]|jgi:single-stranded DNA-binding protein|nr:hypothetical protein [Solirubrobacteraceae bacterium]